VCVQADAAHFLNGASSSSGSGAVFIVINIYCCVSARHT